MVSTGSTMNTNIIEFKSVYDLPRQPPWGSTSIRLHLRVLKTCFKNELIPTNGDGENYT